MTQPGEGRGLGKPGALGLIMAFFVLALLMCPVNAETKTGTLETSGTYSNVDTYSRTGTGLTSFSYIAVNKSEGFVGTATALVRWDTPGYVTSWTTTNSAEANIPFDLRNNAGTHIIATGTAGYQRYWNSLGVEQSGYQYFVFEDWNSYRANWSGITGNTALAVYKRGTVTPFTLNSSGIYSDKGGTGYPPQYYHAFIGASGEYAAGLYTLNSIENTKANYSFTQPQGLNINGSVIKNVSGTAYSSKIYITDGYTGAPLASDLAVNSVNLPLNTLSSCIRVNMNTPLGNWVNSSVLFTCIPPTTTPTATLTPIPGLTPVPGYVRTYVENVDGRTNGQVHGSTINIKDVENSSWKNWTNDLDGNGYIDTLPSHTIDAYGTATGYIAVSRTGLPSFSEGIYELIMWGTNDYPAPGAGSVNLIVLVYDKSTQAPISGAELSAIFPNGTMLAGVTGSSGQEIFTVPNSSVIRVTASRIGYLTGTKTTTTTSTGPDTIRIELSRQTVTTAPTATTGPGGTTPIPSVTVDGRTDFQKDQDLMDQIRNSGSGLVTLAILATFCGLLGLMRKGM